MFTLFVSSTWNYFPTMPNTFCVTDCLAVARQMIRKFSFFFFTKESSFSAAMKMRKKAITLKGYGKLYFSKFDHAFVAWKPQGEYWLQT